MRLDERPDAPNPRTSISPALGRDGAEEPAADGRRGSTWLARDRHLTPVLYQEWDVETLRSVVEFERT
jgi:hypothetical protein